MEKVSTFEASLLSEAVQVWTGWGQHIAPRRDDFALVDHFGSEVAEELLPLVKTLEDEYYSSDARLTAANILEMKEMSMKDFKRRNPWAPNEVAEAFAWCYTFDYK